MSKLLIIFLSSLFFAKCLKENQQELNLVFKEMKLDVVGKQGTAVASFESQDQYVTINDTKKEICFKPKISDGKKNHEVKCGLWREEGNYEILIFCDIDSNIPSGDYYILFNETEPFPYKDYIVTLKKCDNVQFKKVEQNIVDLYSETSQTLVIDEEINSYELKFNIVSYNQEPIFLRQDMPLENCRNENNILICTMTKSDLLIYFLPDDTQTRIYYINYHNNLRSFPLIPKIKIIINEFNKKDIFVRITKLLVNFYELYAPIIYETNVTDISNLYFFEKCGYFYLTFKTIEKEGERMGDCHFVKYDNAPLYILCRTETSEKILLKDITKEKIENNINIQYNFRIQPVKIDEPITYIGKNGTCFFWNYPKVLDFTKTNDPLYIKYIAGNHPEYLKGLTFNEKEKDLDCKISSGEIVECEVPKSHFQGKEKGFYYLKYINMNGNRAIRYEVQPIKLIIDDSKRDGGSFASVSIYYLVLLIISLL